MEKLSPFMIFVVGFSVGMTVASCITYGISDRGSMFSLAILAMAGITYFTRG